MTNIEEIKNGGRIEDFIRFSWEVYKGYPNWVPPLIQQTKLFLSGKSYFFKHCKYKLVRAREENKTVATIAAFYDKNLVSHYKERIGLIGYFEALPNYDEAVSKLFSDAEQFLKTQGAKTVWAPFNGNMIYGLALQTDAYDDYPLFLMPYNPPYYHPYFLKNGYKKFKDLCAFTIDLVDTKLQRKVAYIKRQSYKSPVRIKPIDMKRFKEGVFCFAKIYNKTFKNHWGYVPQSNEEIYEMLEPFRIALEQDFVLFAEYNDKIIGFVICVPDYNFVIKNLNGNIGIHNIFNFFRFKKRIKKARLIAIGVDRAYRGQNIAPLLIAHAFDAMVKKGYTTAEYSWVLAENIASQNVINKFYGKLYKHYVLYYKNLKQ